MRWNRSNRVRVAAAVRSAFFDLDGEWAVWISDKLSSAKKSQFDAAQTIAPAPASLDGFKCRVKTRETGAGST